MVYDHHRKGMSVSKVFDDGYISVVVGIGVVFGGGTDFLQGINHNEPAVRIDFQVFLKLPHQTVGELAACHSEMEMFACLVGQLEKPVLYAVKGILQTEIQNIALRSCHFPERRTCRHAKAEL